MAYPLFVSDGSAREVYGKSCEMVGSIRMEAEGAAVARQNVAYEQQPNSLPIGFGGEERGEEVLRHRLGDALAIVRDHQRLGGCGDADPTTFSVTYALHTVLDYIDQYLLEQDRIQTHGNGIVRQVEFQPNPIGKAEVFQEHTAGLHLLAQVAQLQLGGWHLDYLSKTGDEGRHGAQAGSE